jgi:hypothetical protein
MRVRAHIATVMVRVADCGTATGKIACLVAIRDAVEQLIACCERSRADR